RLGDGDCMLVPSRPTADATMPGQPLQPHPTAAGPSAPPGCPGARASFPTPRVWLPSPNVRKGLGGESRVRWARLPATPALRVTYYPCFTASEDPPGRLFDTGSMWPVP